MSLHRMPMARPSPDDWRVHVRYTDWRGRTKTRVVCFNPDERNQTEAQAEKTALDSLRRRGQLPPKIIDVRARRRWQDDAAAIDKREELARRVDGSDRAALIRKLIRGEA